MHEIFLPREVVDGVLINNNNIFKENLGRSLDVEFLKVIMSLRGYTISDGLSYTTSRCSYIKENLDLGLGMGILFRVYDTNNTEVWTHFSLIEDVDIENNRLKIMDPSGIGSYRLINKSDTTFDASFYGAGYTMRPDSLFRYSLQNMEEQK